MLFSAAQSAALAPAKEMPNLIADLLSRPVDVYLPTWSRGHPAALDVHVISPLQQQSLGEAASTPGLALQVGVQCKLTTHLAECQSAGVDFVPIGVEALQVELVWGEGPGSCPSIFPTSVWETHEEARKAAGGAPQIDAATAAGEYE